MSKDREIRIDEESVRLCKRQYPALALNCAECAECEFQKRATRRVDADLDYIGRFHWSTEEWLTE